MEYTKGELFSHALLVGMSSDEYWNGDPSLIYNYDDAFNKKQQYDLTMAWTYGAYVKSAVGSTVLWTFQPAKNREYKKMPEYAKFPSNYISKKPISEEKQKMINEARARFSSLGLIEKKY